MTQTKTTEIYKLLSKILRYINEPIISPDEGLQLRIDIDREARRIKAAIDGEG